MTHAPHLLAAFSAIALSLAQATSTAAPQPIDYQREVRPILSQHCFQCHGPDETARKGGLRLDVREEALKAAKSGELAIVPHKPAASALLSRIFSSDEDELMPPPHVKKPLSAPQRETLQRWVAEGAAYAPHWAYVKPVPPPVPSAVPNAARIANPIDAFIVAELAQHQLAQSPQADKLTLARRVALDLTGLPPTTQALSRYLSDASAQAYERYVNELMQGESYGERWARRWLDLARYADTNGYEKDRERSIWPYRDWVIAALNADMPFDRFTIEQIAGDMLPGSTTPQRIATGFHRNTMLNEEGGIDPLEFRYAAMVDRVATTSATWLGLTMQCCQCHTHKYDPITHTDYFGFMAFLNNCDEPKLPLPDQTHAQRLAQRHAEAEAKLSALITKHEQQHQQDPAQAAAFTAWLSAQRSAAVAWRTLMPSKATSNMPHLAIQADGSVLGSGDITKDDRYAIEAQGDGLTEVQALRLEALPHASLPAGGPGLCYYEGPEGDFFLGELRVLADGVPVQIASASQSFSGNKFGKGEQLSAMLTTDGDAQTGWSCAGRYGERHEAVFVFAQPIKPKTLRVEMQFGRHYACPLGHFRLSTTSAAAATARELGNELSALLLSKADAALTADERRALLTQWLMTEARFAKDVKPIKDLRGELPVTTTLVLSERPVANPRPTHRHHRGEFTQPREAVAPTTLSVLPSLPAAAPRNRLGFARWLVSPDNPLTPRVVMNRQWAVFFGTGLVKTQDDFGYQGELPSHPLLLDWLATEFIRRGWSMKAMHKLIVMSETYRQATAKPSAMGAAESAAVSPRWLAAFPRTRLDAEVIRDSLLRASGLLHAKVGGPSVFPPQPAGVADVAYGAFQWRESSGPDRYRRSLYTFAKRTAPYALTTTFDGPTGEACLAKRETSDTPLQALTTLNDVVFVEAAQALGKLLAAQPAADDRSRTRELYLRALAREPDADELALTTAFVVAQRERLANGELVAKTIVGIADATADQAAWALAARVVFNLDEFITKG